MNFVNDKNAFQHNVGAWLAETFEIHFNRNKCLQTWSREILVI